MQDSPYAVQLITSLTFVSVICCRALMASRGQGKSRLKIRVKGCQYGDREGHQSNRCQGSESIVDAEGGRYSKCQAVDSEVDAKGCLSAYCGNQ